MKNKIYNLVSLILVLCILINLFSSFKIVATEAEKKESKPLIIIDAGHGGEDGGTVAKDGTLEKDVNLKIALYLSEIFKQNDYRVIMTRNSDTDLANKELATVSERKKSDIIKRTEICNNKDASLVISIHQNNFEESKYKGAQMFFGKNESSSILASYVQNDIKTKLQPWINREIKEGNGIYLLNNVINPIIIAECGFLSNESDLNSLKDKNYLKELSMVIYMGCAKYLAEVS